MMMEKRATTKTLKMAAKPLLGLLKEEAAAFFFLDLTTQSTEHWNAKL